MKTWIVIENGRAYKHWKQKINGIIHEGIYPIGNDPKLIAKIADSCNCEIIYKLK